VVVNTSENMPVFEVWFTVSPLMARVGEPFYFDPAPTGHPWLSDSEIAVRWDFDGDPEDGWDLDWDAGARADQVVTRSFDLQGIYLIRMQARGPFLPDSVSEAQPRQIRVLPLFSDPPPPPDPDNYVSVPAGLYPISKADSVYVLEGARMPVDASELPPHWVCIEQPFAISRYEVTNRLYLQYLERELQQERPNLQLADGEIRERLSGGASGKLYCRLRESRIFFDLDQERFVIEAGFEEHPVTGVTWSGAEAYALLYGLRLPTEAEWEVAGRGTTGELDYPFPGGSDLSLDEARRRMNIVDTFNPGEPFDGTTTPVGYFDGAHGTTDTRSEFGLYDLSGNVAEWVSDWFGPYQPGTAYSPPGPPNGVYKVVRGGGHSGTRVDCRATARRAYDPEVCSRAIGFRCAFDLLWEPRPGRATR
jgi:formylglycine-generating enzyme required for sulfatase activity